MISCLRLPTWHLYVRLSVSFYSSLCVFTSVIWISHSDRVQSVHVKANLQKLGLKSSLEVNTEQFLVSAGRSEEAKLTVPEFPPIMIKKLDNFLNAPAVGLFVFRNLIKQLAIKCEQCSAMDSRGCKRKASGEPYNGYQ